MSPGDGADEPGAVSRELARRQRRLRARIAQQRAAWVCGERERSFSRAQSPPDPSLAELGFAIALHACRTGVAGRRGPLLGAAFALLGARIAVLMRRLWTDRSGAPRSVRASRGFTGDHARGDAVNDAGDRAAPCRGRGLRGRTDGRGPGT